MKNFFKVTLIFIFCIETSSSLASSKCSWFFEKTHVSYWFAAPIHSGARALIAEIKNNRYNSSKNINKTVKFINQFSRELNLKDVTAIMNAVPTEFHQSTVIIAYIDVELPFFTVSELIAALNKLGKSHAVKEYYLQRYMTVGFKIPTKKELEELNRYAQSLPYPWNRR